MTKPNADRLATLYRELERTAAAHADLIDELRRSGEQRQWTCDEMGEPGGDAIEVRARVRYMGRAKPLEWVD